MNEISIVFPHQLFDKHPAIKKRRDVLIIEDPLFFGDHKYPLNFHKMKLTFHRARYFEKKKSYFQHYFYIDQRKKFNILLEDGKPVGGKWSLDSENRKSLPKNLEVPKLNTLKSNLDIISKSQEYVNKNFGDNPGENNNFYLPVTHKEAKNWLDDFLADKLLYFGDYQDAIVRNESFLFHSLLSPLINSGLLTPDYVIKVTLDFVENNSVPLNSVEGFIRQIIGWREFIRGVYLLEGVQQRNSNFWNNKREIPKSFYNGTTGIDPIDDTIRKLLKTGYNHHIERLMILGNFMLLCEIHPTEVYNWFMEMYIDAYDWVMVPNVYGMSQFADGGLMSTKPYISSSNYVKKMSDYKSGSWTKIWDALFWNFISKHHKYFLFLMNWLITEKIKSSMLLNPPKYMLRYLVKAKKLNWLPELAQKLLKIWRAVFQFLQQLP
jgi:deoxyribodipyrimidine photolyase-related protein